MQGFKSCSEHLFTECLGDGCCVQIALDPSDAENKPMPGLRRINCLKVCIIRNYDRPITDATEKGKFHNMKSPGWAPRVLSYLHTNSMT